LIRAPPLPFAPPSRTNVLTQIHLLVRLPNHLGDTIMALPALQRLADSGCALTLAGRIWAGALLAAYPWRVLALPAGRWARWRALRMALAKEPRADAALLLTNSFSTALEMRLLNVPATGYAGNAREWLLRKAVAIPPRWPAMQMHMVEYYDTLAGAWLGQRERAAPAFQLVLPPAARAQATALLHSAGIKGEYVLLCPGATGTHHGQAKTWTGFGALCDQLLARGLRVAACPGPGERGYVQSILPHARLLPDSDVATFAALLEHARMVIANDSGPSHLAAAVGARLITVFGATQPQRTRPWSPRARIVGENQRWPELAEVRDAVEHMLAAPPE